MEIQIENLTDWRNIVEFYVYQYILKEMTKRITNVPILISSLIVCYLDNKWNSFNAVFNGQWGCNENVGSTVITMNEKGCNTWMIDHVLLREESYKFQFKVFLPANGVIWIGIETLSTPLNNKYVFINLSNNKLLTNMLKESQTIQTNVMKRIEKRKPFKLNMIVKKNPNSWLNFQVNNEEWLNTTIDVPVSCDFKVIIGMINESNETCKIELLSSIKRNNNNNDKVYKMF